MTLPLWTSEDAVAATGGTSVRNWVAQGVSIDTRTLKPGDLFVALKAARDGHDFVAQALAAGAAAALVSRVPDGVADDAPLLVVDDVLQGLERLGVARRAAVNARIVAVTGSVGKTSTKEMLRTVLARQGRTHASVASYNNHWGVPLTLARMPVDTQFGVFEVGMNHPGEIAPLSRMIRPHVAMVTTVAPAHLEAFESLDGIAVEKGSIVAGLEPGGAAILPADIPTAPILIDAARQMNATLIGFGERAEAFRLVDAALMGDATIVQASMRGLPLAFKISAAGRHYASNALAVLAATEALGADPGRAAVDLVHWHPPKGRGSRETIVLDPAQEDGSFALFDGAYNANPTSMAAAFDVLAHTAPGAGGRRIVFIGDMLELGDQAETLHAALADDENLKSVDVVHCAGPLAAACHAALPAHQQGLCVDTAAELAKRASHLVQCGDVVLVKGSNGSKISVVVDALRHMGHR